MKSISKLLSLAVIFAVGSFFIACQSDKKTEAEKVEEATNDVFDQARRAIDDIEKNVKESQDGVAREVDLEEFKDWIPNEVFGMQRKSRDISKANAMGFNTVSAESVYEDDDAKVEIEVVHFGGYAGFISSMAQWADMEVYKEGDDYYEKTIDIDGHKAFVKFNERTGYGEYNILMDDYIVNIQSRNLSERRFKRLPEEIDLDDLPKPKSR